MVKRVFYFIFTVLFYIISFSIYSQEKGNNDFIKSQEFYDIVNYAFAVQLYDHFFKFTNYKFENNPNADGYKIYPKLGQKITGKIWKLKDGYLVDFENDLTNILRYIRLVYDINSKSYYTSYDSIDKEDGVYVGQIEFIIPKDFIKIASQFGADSDKKIIKLKQSLTRILEQYPNISTGIYHFYVNPFSDHTEMIYIYWVESKSVIRILHNSSKELSDLEFTDVKIATWEEEENTMIPMDEKEKTGRKIYDRYCYSNAVVANCVRDGKLIVVEKK